MRPGPAHGIPNLKCYFMIGQPTETDEDVEAIPDLAVRLLDRLRVPAPDGQPFGRLTLSISSFVPKPWTPFQWAPFARVGRLEAKLRVIKAGVRRFPNVRVLHENPREAFLQAMLARGDRRVSDFLAAAAEREGDWRSALRDWDGDAEFYTYRPRALDETFPWDHLEVGVKKAGLLREHERAGLSPELAGMTAEGRRTPSEAEPAMTQPEAARSTSGSTARPAGLDRRLYVHLLAFAGCDDPSVVGRALEGARLEGGSTRTRTIRSAWRSRDGREPRVFVGRWRELSSGAAPGAPAEPGVLAVRADLLERLRAGPGGLPVGPAPADHPGPRARGPSGTRCGGPGRSRSSRPRSRGRSSGSTRCWATASARPASRTTSGWPASASTATTATSSSG